MTENTLDLDFSFLFFLCLYVTLFNCCSTVCEIFNFSLIPNLSLPMFLTCFLSFLESEGIHKFISYIKSETV